MPTSASVKSSNKRRRTRASQRPNNPVTDKPGRVLLGAGALVTLVAGYSAYLEVHDPIASHGSSVSHKDAPTKWLNFGRETRRIDVEVAIEQQRDSGRIRAFGQLKNISLVYRNKTFHREANTKRQMSIDALQIRQGNHVLLEYRRQPTNGLDAAKSVSAQTGWITCYANDEPLRAWMSGTFVDNNGLKITVEDESKVIDVGKVCESTKALGSPKIESPGRVL